MQTKARAKAMSRAKARERAKRLWQPCDVRALVGIYAHLRAIARILSVVYTMFCFHLYTAFAAAKGRAAACLGRSRSGCLGNSCALLGLTFYALQPSFDVLRWKDGMRGGI